MATVRQCLERHPQQGPAVLRSEIAPSSGTFHGRWPVRKIACERSKRWPGEEVNAPFEALFSDPLRDHSDQSAAPRAGEGILQAREFRSDRMIRSAAHVGSR